MAFSVAATIRFGPESRRPGIVVRYLYERMEKRPFRRLKYPQDRVHYNAEAKAMD